MRIHIVHCGRSASPWTHQYTALHAAVEAASPRLHELTDDPAQADFIFLTNDEQPEGRMAASHPLLQRYPEKCFLFSEQWRPPFLLAGVYANAPRALLGRGRFRTGSYFLHHPDFHHPDIRQHTPADDLPAEKRDLLMSFLGRDCHPVRRRILDLRFNRPDILVEDTSDFNAFTHLAAGKADARRRYYETSLRSKFILCPRGCGPGSIRLFEALRLGIAPIIVADDWIPCEGPDWRSFALFVREKEVHRLEEIAVAAEPHFAELGRRARQAHDAFFAADKYFNFLVANAVSMRAKRLVPEAWLVALLPWRRRLLQLQDGMATRTAAWRVRTRARAASSGIRAKAIN